MAPVASDHSLRGDWVAGKSRSRRQPWKWFEAYFSIGVMALVAAAWFLSQDRRLLMPNPLPNRDVAAPNPLPSREPHDQESARKASDLPPEQPLPDNGDGVFEFERAETTSRIKIVPRPKHETMVVKIERWEDNQLVCWFLIQAGESAETSIPAGSYRLKFASGRKWYGEHHLFGPSATYFAVANPINIPAKTNYTLNLTPSPSGIIREYTIGPRDF
jgi:hypothetical protein